jgi:hypothetical protein
MTPRRRTIRTRRPRLVVVLLADRGYVASHLVDDAYPGSLCGLSRGTAVPCQDPDELRVTCERCRSLAASAVRLGVWS